MAPIDWLQVGAVVVGTGVGASFAYFLMGRRKLASRWARARDAAARKDPARHAALFALAAFFGCTVVEDLVPALGREEPGGFFLLKYILAAALGIATFAHLVRRPRPDESGVDPLQP